MLDGTQKQQASYIQNDTFRREWERRKARKDIGGMVKATKTCSEKKHEMTNDQKRWKMK
jgi:hypothetical protein